MLRNACVAWFLILLSLSAAARERSWHKITFPAAAQVASGFLTPPPGYGMTLWWGWDGPVDEAAIRRDLDAIRGFGFSNVMIEAGYNMGAPYLSSGWFDLVRTAVNEAGRRRMRVWVEDEGKYPSRGKDTNASLMDYLNPDATRQFLVWTHEKYKRAVSPEFGRTFMGFMGDEPDYSIGGIPWSPRLTDEARRIKADYWDVWSKLFSEHFFKVQAEWCRANGVEYIVHLNWRKRS